MNPRTLSTTELPRFRPVGLGVMMAEGPAGTYLRVEDVRAVLEVLHRHAADFDKPLVQSVIDLLGAK